MNRLLSLAFIFLFVASFSFAGDSKPAPKTNAKQLSTTVAVGTQAPAFKIKDVDGKEIDLAELTAKGPVLVRLTCGCSGCDKELAYFQALNDAYKDKGLTCLFIFKEPDGKVA